MDRGLLFRTDEVRLDNPGLVNDVEHPSRPRRFEHRFAIDAAVRFEKLDDLRFFASAAL